jgi:hypothetical protein
MSCALCASVNEAEFTAEMMIHFSGLKYLANPGVFVFRKVSVYLDCGSSRFSIAEPELGRLSSAMARDELSHPKTAPLRSHSVARDCA